MSQLISLLQQSGASDKNATARVAAIEAMQQIAVQPTSLISYASRGSLLLIAEPERLAAIKPKLGTLDCIHTPMVTRLEGHLGEFGAFVETERGETSLALLKGDKREHFDLILDLSATPYWQREMQAFGYFAPQDEVALQAALEQIVE
ncbi:MAG: hypothetical protein OEX03_10445, partial [Gammaproteobacteria bacterium]|nr:hypothetical protein [Gammaproteobacteria bacterium]